MRTRAPRLLLTVAALVGCLGTYLLAPPASPSALAQQQPQAQPQKLVEDVQVEGNRRMSDEGVLYYIQTRPGDPYNEEQVRRDVQALLALPFFDKTEVRVSTADGPRGGVVVIFTVKELPVIRDLTFPGMSSVSEADVLKAFRENRVGVSKEATYDPVKVKGAERTIKELLAAKGRPNATVTPEVEQVTAQSVAIAFRVEEGERVRVVEIDFEGNKVFSDGQLRGSMQLVKEAGLFARFKGQDILDTRKLEYDLGFNVTNYMRSKGYLQARTLEPRIEDVGRRRTGFPVLPLPILSSTDDALRVVVPVSEGKLFRVGEVKVEGNSIIDENVIRLILGLKAGDVANGQRLFKALQEDLKRVYGRAGFIQYDYEVEPSFRDSAQNPAEGIADFQITITEGKQFSLRRLEFLGNTFTRDNVLRREVLLSEGDIYDQSLMEFSVLKLNQTGYFDPIDDKKDLDVRTDDEQGLVDANLKVVERGRQQISFNGGLAGAAGSFFGLEYSTNNLLGRGESLAFQVAFGNRQRSFLFSFTEPYVRDRPISIGFSLFTESRKFFGEGTFLSSNVGALTDALSNNQFTGDIDEQNLFTQTSTGASLFASAPLSEFYNRRSPFSRASRIGLSYTISQSSVKDPPVNEQGDSDRFIPQVFQQPNIMTSRVTPTFVYDTRNGSIDPTSGRQFSIQIPFAGLGGDVRTYQPSVTFMQFIPVRRKRSENPEVFGFRVLASHVASFAKTAQVLTAEQSSLSFINGVPVFERFFLGDEFTIRGYSTRSISPLVPLDFFLSSRGVAVSASPTGAVEDVANLSQTLRDQLIGLGTFTGAAGTNSLRLSQRDARFLGGDTQILGNFEYRIPIVSRIVSAALFADVGTSFNLRTSDDQTFSSDFLADTPFLQTLGVPSLSSLVSRNNPQVALGPGNPVALTPGGLILRDNRLVTREEFANALRVGPTDPLTGLPFGFQEVFLRGDVQTNTVARLSESLFSKFSDIRSSVGGELRIQLPVVNVPFRLIYAFNPNARDQEVPGIPGLFIRDKKRLFRFSIGRTF